MARERCKLKNERGQAAVEFIAVAVVIFFFILFFMSLAFMLVASQYADYATFMAARTYKAALSSPEAQERRAKQIYTDYMDKIQGIVRNYDLQIVNAEPDRWQSAGVTGRFDINLFYMPPLFITQNPPTPNVTLTTEAHLGREPSVDECVSWYGEFSRRLGLGIEGTPFQEMMDDNGC